MNRKSIDLFAEILEESPQHRHFAREIAVSKDGVLLVLSLFLVDPIAVLVSPSKWEVN